MVIGLEGILKDAQSVALGGHVRPDGDCTGSSVGLYLYLKENYPNIDTNIYLETVPKAYQGLHGVHEVKHEIPSDKQYDLFISLDCGDEGRLGFSAPLFRGAKRTFCIDHHVSNRAFGDDNYIIFDASSTSELVFRILDVDKISTHVASALFMGIAHDTGVFQYSCTSPETMEAAAMLMRKGIKTEEIIEKTFYEKTYVQNQILGKALFESSLILDKKCIVSIVSKDELEFYNASPEDLEGIVSQLKITQGVEVALFMYEFHTQEFKVSLRSRDKVNVSAIAQHFGGGGHVKAAGFTMKGSRHDVMGNVAKQIELHLK